MAKRTEEGTWYGLTVSAEIISGDWQGDPSIPGGVEEFPDYVEMLYVIAPDGCDITELLKDSVLADIEKKIINGSL